MQKAKTKWSTKGSECCVKAIERGFIMNKKHIGSSVSEDIKKWEENPSFKKAVKEYKEKALMGMLLKHVRKEENLSQNELAKISHVTQSVIARIETCSTKTLPRLDIYNKILNSIGYKISLVASKNKKKIQVALS